MSAADQDGLPQIDVKRAWRISHELAGHKDDVKALSLVQTEEGVEAFASASRDQTSCLWKRRQPDNRPGNRPPSQWFRGPSCLGNRYQNSVATFNDKQEDSLGLLIVGGLDAKIRVYRMPGSAPVQNSEEQEPFQILHDHFDNVCRLSVSSQVPEAGRLTLLISASWDFTSRVWRLRSDAKHGSLWSSYHVLKGHEAAVWSAKVVESKPDEERYLTASADHFVRLWNGESLCRIFAGHTDVARGIALLPQVHANNVSTHASLPQYYDGEELFASISNDGSLRVWSLDERRWPSGNSGSGGEALRVLSPSDGEDDILYDVCCVGRATESGARLVATSGEGGMVRMWDIESGSCVSTISQPITSAWGLIVLPQSGDIVTADSDSKIRVYTQRNFNSSFMAQERRAEVRARGGLIELDVAQMKEHDQRCQAIALNRQRRNGEGIQADLIAVEGTNDSTSSDALVFEGKRYDSILSIDVSDDCDPLMLPINKGDDAEAKAKDFIRKHSLSLKYEDEIVSFIKRFGPGS